MKVSKCLNKIESIGQNSIVLWLVWLLYTVLVVSFCYVHEPWGDEYHAWSMVYRMSFPELWDAMRIEGHFILWHLCLLPWVKLFGMDYHALYVTSSLLMSLAVWLMLFKLNFGFIGKLFIVFSSPFFYYFPVISRCYALIPPILIALAVVYQKKGSPYLYCLLMGLLAHTHAYMEGMVGVLWCLFVYYNVYSPYKNDDIQRAKKNCWASGVTIFLVLLAFIQVAGGIEDAATGTGVATKIINKPVDWIVYFYQHHHIQLTTTLHTHVCRFLPVIDLPITLTCYFAISILLYIFINKTKNEVGYFLLVFISVVWQICFALNIYMMQFQRVYLIYLPILYVIWIGYNTSNGKYGTWICICFWLLNTLAQYEIIYDFTQEYCFNVSVAKRINENLLEDHHIVSYAEECGKLLNKEIIFLDEEVDVKNKKIEDVLYATLPNDTTFYLITSFNVDSIIKDGLTISEICSGIEGNNYFTGIGYKRKVSLYKCDKR